MSGLGIALSEEQERALLAAVEDRLFQYVLERRAAAIDDLTSFSVEEIATVKGWTAKFCKGYLTRHGVSLETFGYKVKRYPLRELRCLFDKLTERRLKTLRSEKKAAA